MNDDKLIKSIAQYIDHCLHDKKEDDKVKSSTASRNWTSEFEAEAYIEMGFVRNPIERQLLAETTTSFQKSGMTFYRDKPDFAALDSCR